jgi:hypothetical protein
LGWKTIGRLILLAAVALAGSNAPAQNNPSVEYIRLGGRIIAIERAASIAVSISPETATANAGQTV